MRLGIAHHLGWAVAITASASHEVVDRRRIELIEPGMPTAPIHHEGKPLDDAAAAALVAQVRASAMRAATASLDELVAAVPGLITSMSIRAWPSDFPSDISVQRRAPYEAQADSIMYREVLAEIAHARGWAVRRYDAKHVEARAISILSDRAGEVLHGPRQVLGPPWTKDHRQALAATIVAGGPHTDCRAEALFTITQCAHSPCRERLCSAMTVRPCRSRNHANPCSTFSVFGH